MLLLILVFLPLRKPVSDFKHLWMSIFITDPFSVATIENSELIPLDVYQSINESLELKCLLDAHHEKLNEVNFNIISLLTFFFLVKIFFVI